MRRRCSSKLHASGGAFDPISGLYGPCGRLVSAAVAALVVAATAAVALVVTSATSTTPSWTT
jgi:hypothetical protein